MKTPLDYPEYLKENKHWIYKATAFDILIFMTQMCVIYVDIRFMVVGQLHWWLYIPVIILPLGNMILIVKRLRK